MQKKLPLLFLLIVSNYVFSQAKRTTLFGLIKNDSKVLGDIHVLNKNSGKGTITNSSGQFRIPVKENDTLLMSGIQFYFKELIISKKIIQNKTVTLNLFLKINELQEVEVKSHNLSGNLTTDLKKLKDSISKVSSDALDFSMIDFGKPVINDIDAIDRQRPPNASNLTNPNIPIGGDVFGLLKLVLSPLFKEAGKIGKTKRKLKRQEKEYQTKALEVPDQIVMELGELFFIDTLKIPKEQIDSFIEHCKSKGIIDLYIKDRKIELLDMLIKQSKVYKNLKK